LAEPRITILLSRNSRQNVLLEIETRYLLTYRLPEGTEEGWHDIEVELEKHKAAIRARAGFCYKR
jgi:hypothetical protein